MKTTSSYEIGNYVLCTDGKIRKITGDDMPDLSFEEIERKLTDKESPHFEFALKHGNETGDWSNLNRVQFFDPLHEKCPASVDVFCKWIDKYKKAAGWNKLFNSDSNWQDSDGKNAPAPKFHDLPWEMQFGILLNFFSDTIGFCGFPLEQFGDWQQPEEVVDAFVENFIFLELGIRNGEIKA